MLSCNKTDRGSNKEVINTPAQRVKLVNNWEMPKAQPTKRVYIPKPNGKKRPLGIPTVKDRIAQAIVKNTIEPEWEAIFEPNSYEKEKVLAFCKKIGKTLSEMKARTQEDVIRKLNPLLRGFANYYRGVVSKETFSYIENRVWHYLYRWAKRRHPNKSKTWVFKRYFHSFRGKNGTFMCKGTGRKGGEVTHILYNISSTPIVRHIKVKGKSSPDDPLLREYWENRQTKEGKSYWAKGSKYEQVAKQQNWKCPVCNDPLFNGEEIETHHIVPVKKGGSDDTENLIHLHKACHKQEHSKNQVKGLK